ncbi:MAG: helix-turn-helix domain-containing protein [Salinibacterium sp.]|nr:helix-turn-helix domain-containing protein [Salinibacterium sp.]
MISDLNPALAQRLVDQVGVSVARNVNLMDAHGIIIGSLDPARVGAPHQAAQRAAETRQTVRITNDAATDLVRPGVNVPLIIDGDVVGVVGVTGDPDEVEEVARLLVLALLLIIDAESESDARTARDAVARDLIAALAAGITDASTIRSRATAAGATLVPPFRVMVAYSVISEESGASADRQRATPPVSSARLLRAARTDPSTLAVIDQDALWVIHGSEMNASNLRTALRAREFGARTIDSGRLEGADELSDSVRRCRSLLGFPNLVRSPDGHLAELELEALVASMDSRARDALIVRTVGALRSIDRATAEAVVAAGGSMTGAAARLGLHRNSLGARLTALHNATGRDPRNPAEQHRLALGLLASTAVMWDREGRSPIVAR